MKVKQKSLLQKWQPVLEAGMGAPITSQAQASVIATLLENQVRLNKGALPESVNVTSDVAVYQQYALPLIRRQFPELLAMNTVAVIPTTTPQGIYFALRHLYNEFDKTNGFRNGKKAEIGFDLDKAYTGKGGNAYPTREGEFLSNYMEAPTGREGEGFLSLAPDASRIKTASIQVIKGSVIVGTRAIKSHYTLELQQDLAAVHGQDVESLLLEALQFEIQQEIDREILSALIFAATSVGLGGEAPIQVDLASVGATPSATDGRWAAERIAGGIVNTILAVAQKLAVTTRMGSGNWAIVSPDVLAAITTLNNGIYTPGGYMGAAVDAQPAGGVAAAGSLQNGGIKLYRDIYATSTYALVGYKGPRQGESGIIFMPYIPYIFTKTAGQDDGSPRLIVKSRYAIVANLLGAGQFYRYVEFANINGVILGIDSSNDAYPWEVQGATYDAGVTDPNVGIGGIGSDGQGGTQGDLDV